METIAQGCRSEEHAEVRWILKTPYYLALLDDVAAPIQTRLLCTRIETLRRCWPPLPQCTRNVTSPATTQICTK